MYATLIKIDETLPWIELKRDYETRKQAKEAAKNLLSGMTIKIVAIPDKRSPMKALPTIKVRR